MTERTLADKVLFAVVVGLILFGAVMVYSASAVLARQNYHTPYHFFVRQGLWALITLAAVLVVMRIDYHVWTKPAVVYTGLALCVLALFAVFAFRPINGAHRWFRLGIFSFQPSEAAKLAGAIYLAYFLGKKAETSEIEEYKLTYLPSTLVIGLLVVLVCLEPDLGTALLICLVLFVMQFAAGVPVKFQALTVASSLPVLAYQLLHVGFRAQRLKAFLNPFEYQYKEGFQVVQSLIAIGSGGVSGLGFAQSKQKLFFLPESHTDFIFSVIGEELGLVGAMTVVLLFGILLWRGVLAAKGAPDLTGRLLAIGLTLMLVLQAFFNMSVTMSLAPAKGIPLPFVSYGGSSVLLAGIAAAILLNISSFRRQGN